MRLDMRARSAARFGARGRIGQPLLQRQDPGIGVAWGEYIRHDPAMPQRIARSLDALWSAGKLNPLVGGTYPLERAADALREIEDRRAIGKVVLTPHS